MIRRLAAPGSYFEKEKKEKKKKRRRSRRRRRKKKDEPYLHKSITRLSIFLSYALLLPFPVPRPIQVRTLPALCFSYLCHVVP